MAPNHGGDTIESILGPMRSHWVQKMVHNRKKLPCPKIRILDYPAVIGFSQKMEVTVKTPNHGGKFSKNFDFTEIFEKYWFSSNFRKISIFVKVLKIFDFGQNFRKI